MSATTTECHDNKRIMSMDAMKVETETVRAKDLKHCFSCVNQIICTGKVLNCFEHQQMECCKDCKKIVTEATTPCEKCETTKEKCEKVSHETKIIKLNANSDLLPSKVKEKLLQGSILILVLLMLFAMILTKDAEASYFYLCEYGFDGETLGEIFNFLMKYLI